MIIKYNYNLDLWFPKDSPQIHGGLQGHKIKKKYLGNCKTMKNIFKDEKLNRYIFVNCPK